MVITSHRCQGLGGWGWRGENVTASTELLLQPGTKLLGDGIWADAAVEKSVRKKNMKKTSSAFPTHVSAESAMSWRQRCKEAAMKQNIFLPM